MRRPVVKSADNYKDRDLSVVGLPYHNFYDVMNQIEIGERLVFKRDKANQYDQNAIAVYCRRSVMFFFSDDIQIGFITAERAKDLAPLMDSGKEFHGVVGYIKIDVEEPSLRVGIYEGSL